MNRTAPSARRPEARILKLLAEGEATLEAGEPAVLRVVAAAGLRRLKIDRADLDRLIAADLVAAAPEPTTASTRLALTETGRARLKRGATGEPDFRRQHGAVTNRRLDAAEPAVTLDDAESPLAWLARRRDKDGRAYLTPARVAAGERLRADFTLARMMPTVTSNWSSGRVAASGGAGGLADLTDRALAARDRVRAALAAVGTDLADVLVDVCCFLKGLETIESDRRWPARSAKVVLDIALGRLADHYGLSDEARGPDRARRLRAWGTGDHRPTIASPIDPAPVDPGALTPSR